MESSHANTRSDPRLHRGKVADSLRMSDSLAVFFPLCCRGFPDFSLGQSLEIWHPEPIQLKCTDLDSDLSSATR